MSADKHQFSYWLDAIPVTASDDRCNAFYKALVDNDIARPNGPLYVEFDACATPPEFAGEVNPDWGTVAEDESLLENLTAIAKDFPDFDISFREIDEEDHAIERLTKFHEGEIVHSAASRVISADDLYDMPTVRDIAEYLEDKGYSALSADILKIFKNNP